MQEAGKIMEWCPYLAASEQKRLEIEYKYKSKTEDAELYNQCVEIHDKLTSDEGLRDMYHPYDTNKCESMNKFITNFVPKHTYFAKTVNWQGRVYLAIGIDSIGYEKYFETLFQKLSLTMTKENRRMFQRLDNRRTKNYEYHQQAHVKHKLATMRHSKIIEELKKEKTDYLRGKTYRSGMSAPGEEGFVATRTPSFCPWCKGKGHKTKSSKKCRFSIKTDSEFYDVKNHQKMRTDEEDMTVESSTQDTQKDTYNGK